MDDFTINTENGLSYLKEKLNEEKITSAMAVSEFMEFDDMNISILTNLFCISILMIEEQREQIDGVKEGTVDIMLACMKDTYIEKIKNTKKQNYF